jgi:hypothetical protein
VFIYDWYINFNRGFTYETVNMMSEGKELKAAKVGIHRKRET